MRLGLRLASATVAAGIVFAGPLLVSERRANAADHLDPPARTNIGTMSDTASDVADLFVFGNTTTISLVLTFAGPKEAGVPATYDRDVVYRIHLSNNGDATTDAAVIEGRFGKDPLGNWGIQFLNVPGSTGPITGAVQTPLTSGSIKAEAGLFDDPFFFDLQGFNDTKATGILSIRNDRNFFAGKNDTAMMVDFPASALVIAGKPITAWVETRRITVTGS